MKIDIRVTQFLFLLIFPLLAGCATTHSDSTDKPAGLTYRELELKDYDEMRALVKTYVNRAHQLVLQSESNPDAERDARLELIKAERVILSRPDSDNMVTKLVPEVRREMAEIGSYDDLLEAVTREGIQAFKGDFHLPVSAQTTFFFVLQNLMSEMKPEIATNPRQRTFVERIRDADITLPYDVVAELKIKSMIVSESPSDQAKRILEEAGFKKKR